MTLARMCAVDTDAVDPCACGQQQHEEEEDGTEQLHVGLEAIEKKAHLVWHMIFKTGLSQSVSISVFFSLPCL